MRKYYFILKISTTKSFLKAYFPRIPEEACFHTHYIFYVCTFAYDNFHSFREIS